MYIKRLRYESTERAYNDLFARGVIDEAALNTGGTIAVLDVPGGDYLVVLQDDIPFDPANEVSYLNSVQELIGGRPNDR